MAIENYYFLTHWNFYSYLEDRSVILQKLIYGKLLQK